jgi:hypothetical protein
MPNYVVCCLDAHRTQTQYYEQDSFTVGLLQLPFGISTVVGALIAGKITDFCGVKLGSGGRLIPFHISVAATIVGGIVYGVTFPHYEYVAYCPHNEHSRRTPNPNTAM